MNAAEHKKFNALNELKNKATNKINLLNNELEKFKEDKEKQALINKLSLKNQIKDAVNNLEKEKTTLINQIEKMKFLQKKALLKQDCI